MVSLAVAGNILGEATTPSGNIFNEAMRGFGKMTVFVTDGHLPYPYGIEFTGYEVADLKDTLTKATTSGATVLVEPFTSERRDSAMVQFPGGYIAEIHAPAK
jgi:hypothetical protein